MDGSSTGIVRLRFCAKPDPIITNAFSLEHFNDQNILYTLQEQTLLNPEGLFLQAMREWKNADRPRYTPEGSLLSGARSVGGD